MITTYTKTLTFRISDVLALDPITVTLDDLDPGRGTLTVRCFDRARTCYWGGMGNGESLGQFMQRVDAGYIANCLIRGARAVITKRQVEDREMAYLVRICEAIKAALAMGAAEQAASPHAASIEALRSAELYVRGEALPTKAQVLASLKSAIAELEGMPS
jgi:hypothetical protein